MYRFVLQSIDYYGLAGPAAAAVRPDDHMVVDIDPATKTAWSGNIVGDPPQIVGWGQDIYEIVLVDLLRCFASEINMKWPSTDTIYVFDLREDYDNVRVSINPTAKIAHRYIDRWEQCNYNATVVAVLRYFATSATP